MVPGDLELVSEPVVRLEDGQALVRTLVLSVEAASRIWMGYQRAFMPPVGLGEVMRGVGVGEVVDSRREDMKVGDIVAGFLGWQELCCADDQRLEAPLSVLPSPLPAAVSAFVGILGHPAITAYLGVDFLQPRPGQIVVVSAAAGSVGPSPDSSPSCAARGSSASPAAAEAVLPAQSYMGVPARSACKL